MKRQYLKTLVAASLLIPIFSVNAATYNVGTFYVTPDNPDGNYSIDTSGAFWDEFDFNTRTYNWRDSASVTFSGTHSGMYNSELLLINLNTRQTYNLGEDFSVTLDNLRYGQRFAIAGAGLMATDPSILSSYNLSMDAELTLSTNPPNPVPLPAATWLFASGLMGFVSYRRKKTPEENESTSIVS